MNVDFEKEFERYKALILEKLAKQKPGKGSSKEKERFDRDFEKTKALLASKLENLPDLDGDIWGKEIDWLERHQGYSSMVGDAELGFSRQWLREHKVRLYTYLAAVTRTFLSGVSGEQEAEFQRYFGFYFEMFMVRLLRVLADALPQQ